MLPTSKRKTNSANSVKRVSETRYWILIEVDHLIDQFDQESNPFKQLIISFNRGIREVMKPVTISN